MTDLFESCPACHTELVTTRWDVTFRDMTVAYMTIGLDGLGRRDGERLCFGVPGGLCQPCRQLYVDPDLLALLDLEDHRCVFAIESDLTYRDRIAQRELH